MIDWPRVARRIRVPLGFVLAGVYLWQAKPNLMSLLAGTALIVPGIVVRALASGQVRKNEELTTTGLYAYTRNPLYLGSMILAAGFTVASRSGWIAALMIVFFLAVYLPVIRAEEAFLQQHFPAFEGYARNVPRLLPRLTAYGAGSHRGFSRELYWKHREYNALLGAAAITAALVAKLLFWH
jgi:protein-S-isoprenylcysteine O-methyltransferase Ste14